MNADQLIAQFGEQQVLSFLLVLGRVGPLFILAPMFSSKMMPARAKSVVAVALAVGIAPVAMRTAGTAAGAVPSDVIGLVVVIIVAGPWMLGEVLSWTQELYGSIPNLVGS